VLLPFRRRARVQVTAPWTYADFVAFFCEQVEGVEDVVETVEDVVEDVVVLELAGVDVVEEPPRSSSSLTVTLESSSPRSVFSRSHCRSLC
jgi:hypothetical protein